MICWMFPGQPLKFAEPLPDDDDFNRIAALCRDRADFDLMTCTPLSRAMSEHTRLQIFGTAMSLYHAGMLRRTGKIPDVVAQHSMGIYPALATCGVLGEGDALALAARIGICMSAMGKEREYALGCVVGLQASALEGLLAGRSVYVANYNTSRHFLLSGLLKDMHSVLDAAKNDGAFSGSVFPCDAPLHTPLMAELSQELRAIIADYCYEPPVIPLMTHQAELLDGADQIRSFLHDELLQAVHWEQTWYALKEMGVESFVELGVGDSLKKLNRWIESEYLTR